MTHEELTIKIVDELADILSPVLFIAHEPEIDLNEAWNNMLKSDSTRFSQRNQIRK